MNKQKVPTPVWKSKKAPKTATQPVDIITKKDKEIKPSPKDNYFVKEVTTADTSSQRVVVDLSNIDDIMTQQEKEHAKDLKRQRLIQQQKDAANTNDIRGAFSKAEQIKERQGNQGKQPVASAQERDDILEARAKLEKEKDTEKVKEPQYKVNAYGIKKLVSDPNE